MRQSSSTKRRNNGSKPSTKSRELSRAGSEVHGASGLGSSAAPGRSKGDQR
jgi:hypothetical protein